MVTFPAGDHTNIVLGSDQSQQTLTLNEMNQSELEAALWERCRARKNTRIPSHGRSPGPGCSEAG